jgi:arsenate reductase
MAAALLSNLAGDLFEVESAGLAPGKLNPLAIKAMADSGIDISQNRTQSVFDLFRAGKSYNYVITVCDESQSERCPIFPGRVQRLHWSFADPSSFTGTAAEKLAKTIEVREQIRNSIEGFISQIEDIINRDALS